MPTDIQINDTMVYNEDTRKIGAAAMNFTGGRDDINNAAVNSRTSITWSAVLGSAAGSWYYLLL